MNKPTPKELDQIREENLRPQVVLCVTHEDKILLMYHEKYNLWQLPQGGIQNNESIDDAFQREVKEEIGESFASSVEKEVEVLGEDTIMFPEHLHGSKPLKLDDGTDIIMKGKKYFFCHAKSTSEDIQIINSEFDDYVWESRDKALERAELIYQERKRDLTQKAIELVAQSLENQYNADTK